MSSPAAAVLTLVRGRQAHLDNLMAGLAEQTTTDFELIIASMQSEALRVPQDLPFPVEIVDANLGSELPLAAARNRAACAARAQALVFLDVDCIPGPTLVESYAGALLNSPQCFLGEVRYLPKLERVDAGAFHQLWAAAKAHPARPSMPKSGWRCEPNPRRLWGLSFALPAATFWRVGGMDEQFTGYGGEETDFAEMLASAGTTFAWIASAQAVHQWHPICTPPLDKLESIVRNAQRFHDRWNTWCMERWLEQFSQDGYIDWTPDGDSVRIRQFPSEAAIRRALQPDDVCFA